MLQIIGWLGCFYLVIKAMEIGSGNQFRDSEGQLKALATGACMLAWFGALAFAVWLLLQGDAGRIGPAPASSEMSQSMMDCINKSQTSEEILACK